MAAVNRPVIGQVVCFTQGCDELATVHRVEKGNKTGYLYARCPECKCNQSTGKLFQNYLKENTDFRAEFAHLQVEKPAIAEPEQPKQIEDLQVDEPEPAEVQETAQPHAGRVVGGAILGLVSIFAIIAGVRG